MFCVEVRLEGVCLAWRRGVFGLEVRLEGSWRGGVLLRGASWRGCVRLLEEGRVWLRGASGRVLEGCSA